MSVDYNIANGVYMCPSNMIIKSDSINNYNNKLLISNNLKIGHVSTNNEKLEHNTKKVGHKTTPTTYHKTVATIEHKTVLSTNEITHEEEKAALILGITGIYSIWWFFIK